MSANEIRKSLTIVEGIQTENAVLTERPVPFLKQVATFGKGLFNDMAAGEFQTNRAANKMYLIYTQYLGRTGKKIDQSTIGDLFEFLVSSGIDKNTVLKAITAGITQISKVKITDMKSLQGVWNSEIKDDAKVRLGKTFLLAVQMSQRLPKDQMDDEDTEDRQAAGMAVAKQAAAGAKPVAGKPASKPGEAPAANPEVTPTPEPTTPKTPPATGVEKELETVLSSKDSKAQLASIEKALKSLGAAK